MRKYGDVGRMTDAFSVEWTFMVVRPGEESDLGIPVTGKYDMSQHVMGVILSGETIYRSFRVGPGTVGPVKLGDDIEWLD